MLAALAPRVAIQTLTHPYSSIRASSAQFHGQMNTVESDDELDHPLTLRRRSPSPPPHSRPDPPRPRHPSAERRTRDRRQESHGPHPGDAVLLGFLAPNHPDIAAAARPDPFQYELNSSTHSSSSEEAGGEMKGWEGQRGAWDPTRPSIDSSRVKRENETFASSPLKTLVNFGPSQGSAVLNDLSISPTSLPRNPASYGESRLEALKTEPAPPEIIKPSDISNHRNIHQDDRPSPKDVTLPPIHSLTDVADRGNPNPNLSGRDRAGSYSAASSVGRATSLPGMMSFQLQIDSHSPPFRFTPAAQATVSDSPISSISRTSTIASSRTPTYPSQPDLLIHRNSTSTISSHPTPSSTATEGYSPLSNLPTPPTNIAVSAAENLQGNGGPNQANNFVFKCQHPGCKATPFQTQYLLNSHANVHSNDRPHFCPHKGCPHAEGGKGFKRKNEMKRHQLVHSSPGYTCPFCPDKDHKYPRPDNLQRHVRAHHEGINTDDPRLREVLEHKRGMRGSNGDISSSGRGGRRKKMSG